MSSFRNLNELVTIGITTRNRIDDLRRTIGALATNELRTVRTLVHDDASDCPLSSQVEHHSSVEWSRSDIRKGYIVMRNVLMRASSTRFYLSLDDDSWPARNGLLDAVRWLTDHPDTLAVTFPVMRPDGTWQVKSMGDRPYPTRSFIGCAHLIDLEKVGKLGGYDESLVHQTEEVDLAIRGKIEGWGCIHYPSLPFMHVQSAVARDRWRMWYYGTRNRGIVIFKSFPKSHIPWAWARLAGESVISSVKTWNFAHVAGVAASLCFLNKIQHSRRLRPEVLSCWRALPYY